MGQADEAKMGTRIGVVTQIVLVSADRSYLLRRRPDTRAVYCLPP